MPIKILGGQLKGLQLKVPSSSVTRPTSVLLRRRIFDFFQNLSGVHFVDLCAGSGAMGFEALSRGASALYLIESNRQAFELLTENVQLVYSKMENPSPIKREQVLLVKSKVEDWIFKFKNIYLTWSLSSQEETIIFLDPPYSAKDVYFKILQTLREDDWFKGQLWLEMGESLETNNDGHFNKFQLKPDKTFKQGDSQLFIINFPQPLTLVRS